MTHPGTVLGNFTKGIQEEVGFDCNVVMGPYHDTASAVVACPLGENSMFLSSGTWSLVGMELSKPVTGEDAEAAGFTN